MLRKQHPTVRSFRHSEAVAGRKYIITEKYLRVKLKVEANLKPAY